MAEEEKEKQESIEKPEKKSKIRGKIEKIEDVGKKIEKEGLPRWVWVVVLVLLISILSLRICAKSGKTGRLAGEPPEAKRIQEIKESQMKLELKSVDEGISQLQEDAKKRPLTQEEWEKLAELGKKADEIRQKYNPPTATSKMKQLAELPLCSDAENIYFASDEEEKTVEAKKGCWSGWIIVPEDARHYATFPSVKILIQFKDGKIFTDAPGVVGSGYGNRRGILRILALEKDGEVKIRVGQKPLM